SSSPTSSSTNGDIKFPRLFTLELDKDISVAGKMNSQELRNFIDDKYLPSHTEATRWVKLVPIKVNIFVWRARRDCLPTRTNLEHRGVDLLSSNCPECFTLLGGLFGDLGIIASSRTVLRDVRRFLMILFCNLLIGVIVDTYEGLKHVLPILGGWWIYGLVDPSAFLVDPSPSSSVVDPTKVMGFVPLVDALILSNPKPILQLGLLLFTRLPTKLTLCAKELFKVPYGHSIFFVIASGCRSFITTRLFLSFQGNGLNPFLFSIVSFRIFFHDYMYF
nr:RNA-directed DNA polymerase, eukaryota [Tanacetum cinerariifolium]